MFIRCCAKQIIRHRQLDRSATTQLWQWKTRHELVTAMDPLHSSRLTEAHSRHEVFKEELWHWATYYLTSKWKWLMESGQTTPKLPTLDDVRQRLHGLCCCTAPPKTWHWTVAWAGGNFSSLHDLSRHWRAEKQLWELLSYVFWHGYFKDGFFGSPPQFCSSQWSWNNATSFVCLSLSFLRESNKYILLLQRGCWEHTIHISKSVGEPSVTTGNTCRVFYFIIRLKDFTFNQKG